MGIAGDVRPFYHKEIAVPYHHCHAKALVLENKEALDLTYHLLAYRTKIRQSRRDGPKASLIGESR
jgi:hypothetical protein